MCDRVLAAAINKFVEVQCRAAEYSRSSGEGNPVIPERRATLFRGGHPKPQRRRRLRFRNSAARGARAVNDHLLVEVRASGSWAGSRALSISPPPPLYR